MSKYEADVEIFKATLKDTHEARITKHSWIAYCLACFCYFAFFLNLFILLLSDLYLIINQQYTWHNIVGLCVIQIVFYFTRQKAGSFLFGTSKGDTKGINGFAKSIASFKKKENES